MKTNKINLILVGAILFTPLVYCSCSHPAAAGAATAAAYNSHQDQQKKEDLAKHRQDQRDSR